MMPGNDTSSDTSNQLLASLRLRAREVMSEESLLAAEAYYGASIPSYWRDCLLEMGVPPAVAWHGGSLTLHPLEGAEHQVETEDGQELAAKGWFVIGYVEVLGNCIALDSEGIVYYHDHDGDDERIGDIATFLGQVQSLLEQEPTTSAGVDSTNNPT